MPRLFWPSRAATAVAGLLAFSFLAGGVHAQEERFPTQTVKLIVPTSPGAGMDATTRLLADKLSGIWGKPVIVENRPGGDGVIGFNAFKAAKGDVHTLLIADNGFAAIGPNLQRPQAPDLKMEVKPITDVFSTSFMVLAKPDRHGSLVELLKKASAGPGKLNYGSAGAASGQRLSVELLKAATKTHITFIPYRGNAEALTALLGGDVDLVSIGLPPARAHIESGKLKALAYTGQRRSQVLPDVPTVAEITKVKDFSAESWVGVFGPQTMPANVAEKIQQDVATALKAAELQSFLRTNDYREGGSTTAAFAARIESDRGKYRQLIGTLKLQLD